MAEEQAGKLRAAGRISAFAAWVCDDDGAAEAALVCRGRAADFLLQARGGRATGDSGLEDDLLLADLLRRAGRHERAVQLCNQRLHSSPSPTVAAVLRFQLDLLARGDTACHSGAEARAHIEDDDFNGPPDDEASSPGGVQ